MDGCYAPFMEISTHLYLLRGKGGDAGDGINFVALFIWIKGRTYERSYFQQSNYVFCVWLSNHFASPCLGIRIFFPTRNEGNPCCFES